MSNSKVDIVPSLQAALGSAYTIERELGGGGMSRVFVATETALSRRVVVKVLAPELLQGVSAERFSREVALAAQLQDPHIVPVLTAGATSDGLPYFTMPYVDGESLRERMLRGPVPLEEALRILRDVAEALEYAHARGIVHRDIKPENVLLSGRNAVVADFGIAKAVSAARDTVPGGTLTSVGLSLGTPAYMAPEQAAGDPVDARADLYAWGMVAYELLGGRHPFADCEGMAQLITAQITEVPAALESVRPGLPLPLSGLVMRCLAKKPDERPADAAAVLAELGGVTTDPRRTGSRAVAAAAPHGRGRTMALIAAGLVVVLGGGAWLTTRDSAAGSSGASRAGAAAETPALAVLPFEHQGDSADVYLTEGITDEIRNKLTGVGNLLVIARASSNQYRRTDKTPQQVAEELGVRWLLTGTVQVIGSGAQRRVVVRPELVEVTANGRLRSRGGQPFDGPLTDVVKAQGEVAREVVRSMEVAVGGADEERLVAVPTRDPEAYDLYLRARATILGEGSVPAIKRGLEFYEAAVARDSGLVDAWRGISGAYTVLYVIETPSTEYARRARAALSQLERRAPESVEFYLARSMVRTDLDGDAAGAFRDVQAAQKLAPGDARVLVNMASAEFEVGRPDEALANLEAAIRVDPRVGSFHSNKAGVLMRLRRFDEAKAAVARARALSPRSLITFGRELEVALAAGDSAAARAILARATPDLPRDRVLAFTSLYWFRWWVFEGEDLARLLALPAGAFDVPDGYHMVQAQVRHHLGETAAARAHADSSLRQLSGLIRQTPTDPQLYVLQGLMQAYAGRKADAMAAVNRGLSLGGTPSSTTQGAALAYFQYLGAGAAVLVGERERAIALLRECLSAKAMFTAGWVRLDPRFASLRGDPAFERVLAEAR